MLLALITVCMFGADACDAMTEVQEEKKVRP